MLQNIRINNKIRDATKLYLIDYNKIDTNHHIFRICNIQNKNKITVTINDNTIICDCLDYKFRCYKHNIICKHCIFILENGMKLKLEDNIDGREIIDMKNILNNLNNIHIVNISDNNIFTDNTKNIEKDDCCPICLSDLVDETPKLSCPVCKNYIHRECIEIWLKSSRDKKCVYCRSDIWKNIIYV